MQGRVLWITGLPGSGKSTIADAVKEQQPDIVILRMDDLRKIVTPHPDYTDAEREMVYRCIVYLARTVSSLGHDVIIDATGNRRRWRELARELIPAFAEVYLRCPLDVCRSREAVRDDTRGAPKDVYRHGDAGWPVPGLTVPYEEPLNPELVIDTGSTSSGDAAASILLLFQQDSPWR